MRRALFVLLLSTPALAAPVLLQRVPQRQIQPQVAVDALGTVHLLTYSGDPYGGDLFYRRSTDGGRTFGAPLRVDPRQGTALAVGSVRGAHLALGRDGWVHVAWMGSKKAQPRGPGGAAPMLYTRLARNGPAFEPVRNVLTSAAGLDGGGTVAADDSGRVWVVWHAAGDRRGEAFRRVYAALSTDDGKTFAGERAIGTGKTGCCPCCGIAAAAGSRGGLFVLYRGARGGVHRDLFRLLLHGTNSQSARIAPWEAKTCVMSTSFLLPTSHSVWAAWETEGKVFCAPLSLEGALGTVLEPPTGRADRKHPVVARNAKGETCLAWIEGAGWNRGGSVAWQVFDSRGKPEAERGRKEGVPAFSLVAAFARPDGTFVLLY